MAIRYITWAEAKGHLDEQAVGRIDTAKLQELCGIAENNFDERLRVRMVVPITQAASPEAYKIAQQVTSLWAAASYWRQAPSAEGQEAGTWFSAQLERMAEKLIVTLERPWPGSDVEAAADPLVHVPQDGLTTDTAPAALFKRANIKSGATHW